MSENTQPDSSSTSSVNDSAYDWSRFTKRINVKTSREIIYKAWTTQDELEKWFLRLAEFTKQDGELRNRFEQVEAGDRYKWLWHGWPDSTVESGEMLMVNGTDLLQFSFGKAGNVTVRIFSEEGENLVELVQENIPTDEQGKRYYHLGCMEGWTFYLANLKSILEGGIDLRNKSEKLQKVINS